MSSESIELDQIIQRDWVVSDRASTEDLHVVMHTVEAEDESFWKESSLVRSRLIGHTISLNRSRE